MLWTTNIGPVGQALNGMRMVVLPATTKFTAALTDVGIMLAICMTLIVCVSKVVNGQLHRRTSILVIWGITMVMPVAGLIISLVGTATK